MGNEADTVFGGPLLRLQLQSLTGLGWGMGGRGRPNHQTKFGAVTPPPRNPPTDKVILVGLQFRELKPPHFIQYFSTTILAWTMGVVRQI